VSRTYPNASRDTRNSRENIVKTLLKYGAPTNQDANNNYAYRHTPLGFAIQRKNNTIVKLLLDHGANPNQRDAEGYTPLHRASEIPKNATVIRFLIQRGANVDAKTEGQALYPPYGLTPLHIATLHWHYTSGDWSIENVRVLVDIGRAKVNVKSTDGFSSPLHFAASRKNGEHLVQFLIDRGAHVNAKDHRRQTPLHKAVASMGYDTYGYIHTVKTLLNNGAIPFIQDSTGRTPSDLAYLYNIKHMLHTWPGQRSVLRRMATASMNSIRNRNTGEQLHIPNNVKQQILSKSGLFNRNQYGRPVNRGINNAEIRNAWTKEKQKQDRKRKHNHNNS
jgi:ankyrin repeat protein